jgi:hypothetical protein
MEVNCQVHALATLTPEKQFPEPILYEAGWRRGKSIASSGNPTPTLCRPDRSVVTAQAELTLLSLYDFITLIL